VETTQAVILFVVRMHKISFWSTQKFVNYSLFKQIYSLFKQIVNF